MWRVTPVDSLPWGTSLVPYKVILTSGAHWLGMKGVRQLLEGYLPRIVGGLLGSSTGGEQFMWPFPPIAHSESNYGLLQDL